MLINNYPNYIKDYVAVFEPLFKAAHEVSEFNLIMSLLAFRGASDAGWDPYENTVAVMNDAYKQSKKFRHSIRPNLNFWLYAHSIECSENYELIANLLRTVKGEDYIIANHKNKDFVNLKVSQKIDRLRKVANGTGYENVIDPFVKTYDPRFRNAINHADYALKSGMNGGVTVKDDAGFPKIYTDQEVLDLVNRGFALFEVINRLIGHYTAHYDRSTTIMTSASFGGGTPVEATLIVRKNHGVVGVRATASYTDYDGSPINTQLYKYLPYEAKMIKERGLNDLPPNRIEQINRILDKLPIGISNYLSGASLRFLMWYYNR